VASQQSIPVAIAEPDAATTEGSTRAVIELVVQSAMIRAVEATAERIVGAMVAKSRRQRPRLLPIDLDERGSGRRNNDRSRRTKRNFRKAGEQCKRESFHVRLSDGTTFGGACAGALGSAPIGGHSFVDDKRLSGKRILKRDPSPSLLVTSMPPPCSSTAILTR
jgi:hypothetical protein